MNRKKIVAGNWKMNNNLFEGKQLIADVLQKGLDLNERAEVVIAPPFTQLELAAGQLKNVPGFSLAAQNCHHEASGAYTGEVSSEMLQSVGVSYVILGHSERRLYFNETNDLLVKKVNQALSTNLKVIFCVGEPLEVREAGTHENHVGEQVAAGLFHLSESQLSQVVIAYEPVWAIGTGRTANSEQAQQMHAYIRSLIAQKYGPTVANEMRILYGGSCKPSNAAELFACPDVDGGLIGGAALVADDFAAIIQAAL